MATGRVKAVLHPISFDFQTELNRWGQGSMTLNARDVTLDDVFPRRTSIYIIRLTDPSSIDGHVAFAGYVEKLTASSTTEVTLGLQEITEYLDHRIIRDETEYTGLPQTMIAADLVNQVVAGAIPLSGVDEGSTVYRDRTYEEFDFEFLGKKLMELADSGDPEDEEAYAPGPDWFLTHDRYGGQWSTQVHFTDRAGVDRDYTIQSDREAFEYALDIDAAAHATYVAGLGAGEEWDMLVSEVDDFANTIYPRFDSTQSYKTTYDENELDQLTQGYLSQNREPVAVPSFNIVGDYPAPADLLLGDVFHVKLDWGLLAYSGDVRLVKLAWRVAAEVGDIRTVEVTPEGGRPSDLLTALAPTGAADCEDC